MSQTQWKAPHYGVGAGLLVVGLLAGRAFFPLEIPKPFIVEKEKRVEVPVERIIEQKVPFEVIKYVDRIVEKRVDVPVEKVVQMRVEVPVEKIVEKVVYRDRVGGGTPVGKAAWRNLKKGMPQSEVRELLGEPDRIWGGSFLTRWYYPNPGGYVDFVERQMSPEFAKLLPLEQRFKVSLTVDGWSEP